MITLRKSVITVSSSALCLLAIALASPAFSETASSQNVRTLLDEAKKSAYERKVSAKQKEMDRLSEDLTKGNEEIDGLEKSVEKVGTAVTDTAAHLDQLAADKKRVTQELELINLRIEAEKVKAEGLRLLETANRKSLDALAKRNEETELRTSIGAMELRQIEAKAPPDIVASGPETRVAKGGLTLTELRKKLEKAEGATSRANLIAREAMTTASSRLQQAETAAAKADKKQGEVALEKNPGFPGGNDPLKP